MAQLNILVTGGAGFIGSFIVDALVEKGHKVRVFDCLDPQVHGERGGKPPEHLNKEAEFVYGDIRDCDALDKALDGIDVVYHEAAAVGVAQSMYAIRAYTETNTLGAANLLDLIVNKHRDHVRKMMVASSMSIYGEGRYIDPLTNQFIIPAPRTTRQLDSGDWEPRIPGSDKPAQPAPCDELKPLEPTSVYAVNKRDHEELFLSVGRAYGIPAVALRYFNVYGPRQALSNPYTGVGAIFSSCYLNGRAPRVFEDGLQTRDFIHVTDIAKANLLALERSEADYEAINIGTGRPTSVLGMARLLLVRLQPDRIEDPDLQPKIVGRFRAGDIRHCYADISKARRLLGFEPSVRLEDGIPELIEWVRTQTAADLSDQALKELSQRRLV